MPPEMQQAATHTPRFNSMRTVLSGVVAGLMLVNTSQAIITTLTVVPDGAGVPNTGENVNQDNVWVVGGAASGIDYGTTQGSAVWTIENGPGGTGAVFNAFLGTADKVENKTGENTLEQGHNTASNSQVQPEVNLGTNTDDVQLGAFGITTFDASSTIPIAHPDIQFGNYIVFAYDMNPVNAQANANPHITYNTFQVWISPVQITAQFPNGPYLADGFTPDPAFNLGTKVWDLDANGNDVSLTIHPSNKGSGSFDMQMYIPVGDFLAAAPGATADYYVYVYHEMETYGETTKNDHGYLAGASDAVYLNDQPPGTPLSSIPEPSSALLAGLALLLFCGYRKRK